MPQPRVALVTGGNRGIGFEVCRQLAGQSFTVILGARDPDKGQDAARQLADAGGTVVAQQLDVTDGGSVERAVRAVAVAHGGLDVLVNNAGILYDTWQRGVDADLGTRRPTFSIRRSIR